MMSCRPSPSISPEQHREIYGYVPFALWNWDGMVGGCLATDVQKFRVKADAVAPL